MIIQTDKSTFDSHIKSPCVVDFYTSGCPSCEKFAPVFEQAAPQHSDYKFVKVNLDDDITLAERYGITHIPTVMKFIEGEPVETAIGYLDDVELSRFIDGEETIKNERVSD